MRSGPAETMEDSLRPSRRRPAPRARAGRRLLAAAAIVLLTLLAAAFTTVVDASGPGAPTIEFTTAERMLPDGTVGQVRLPDQLHVPQPAEAPYQVRYRMAADLGPVKPHAQALYFPGLRAPAPDPPGA